MALKEGHAPTADYVGKLRKDLPAAFPDDLFYFQPADMTTQILNFGLTAQINVRTVGYDRAKNLRVAEELRRRIAAVPGIADAHLQQVMLLRFVGQCLTEQRLESLARTQRRAQVHLVIAEETGTEPTVGREPNAIA